MPDLSVGTPTDQAELILINAVLTEADRLLKLINGDLDRMQQTLREMGS